MGLRVDVGNKKITFTRSEDDVAKINFARVGGSWKLRGNAYLRGLVAVVVDPSTGVFDVTMPKEWFNDNKNFQVEINTNNWQDYTFNLNRDNIIFYTIIVGEMMTRSSIKADVTFESKDTELVDSFLELVGVSKYRLCQTLVSGCFTKGRYSLEAKSGKLNVNVEKENKKVLEFDVMGTR